ncbi:hypothetical protein MHYP_G00099210 [Metynnis hypsauchen]
MGFDSVIREALASFTGAGTTSNPIRCCARTETVTSLNPASYRTSLLPRLPCLLSQNGPLRRRKQRQKNNEKHSCS